MIKPPQVLFCASVRSPKQFRMVNHQNEGYFVTKIATQK